MKILLLSDSHSYIDDRILEYAKNADEIWHCGDFGNMDVIEKLEKIKPLRGVYGNIDGTEIRKIFPEVLRFKCEEVEVLMIHIGGYPGKYTPLAKKEIAENTGCSLRTVGKHIKELEREGFIKINKSNHKSIGTGSFSSYYKPIFKQ